MCFTRRELNLRGLNASTNIPIVGFPCAGNNTKTVIWLTVARVVKSEWLNEIPFQNSLVWQSDDFLQSESKDVEPSIRVYRR